MDRQSTNEVVDAVVVGAGFGGLYAVKRFRDAGFTVQAFEAAAGSTRHLALGSNQGPTD